MKFVHTFLLITALICFHVLPLSLTAQPETAPEQVSSELCDKIVPEFKDYTPPPMPPNPQPGYTLPLASSIFLGMLLVIGGIIFHLRLSRWWLVGCMAASLIVLGFIKHGCVCPVGSIGNILLSLFHSDKYTIGALTVVGFFAPLVAALFAGRIFCGAACPLGAIQELTLITRLKLPSLLDRILCSIKYLVLLAVVFYAINTMFLPLCKFDPYVTLFRLNGSAGMWIYTLAFILLGTIIPRPFCRYLCPYGILLGLISLLAIKKRAIDQIACISCKKCTKDLCPVDAIEDNPPKINIYSCVACGRCNKICPKRVHTKMKK